MTSPIEDIIVRCPNRDCRVETFRDWTRRSINLGLDSFSEGYVRECQTATCPACRTELDLGGLVVRRHYDEDTGRCDETWEVRS